MNLTDSKKKLALAGAVCGIVAVVLALLGNPANMAFCIACFIRDTAGAFGMHQAEVVQYARPEIIGLVLGAFLISVATKEYRSTAGSSPMIRFVLGVIIMIGALVFLGCPLRMIIRMSAGDLNAWVALVGFILGIATGVFALKRGFSLGRAHATNRLKRSSASGYRSRYSCTCSGNSFVKRERGRSGKYACTDYRFFGRRSCIWSICTEIQNVFRRKYA